jgi:plasmid maintenance system killer protein
LEVTFESNKLERICEDEKSMVRRFGPKQAKRLMLRLDDLLSADTLEDLRNNPGRYHPLKGNWSGHISVDLVHPYRLIFRPTADPPPVDPGGGLDWSKVTAVTIVKVEDTH